MVGVVLLARVCDASLSRARAQTCADAVALALTERTVPQARPLLDALGARIVSVSRNEHVVTVTVDTPWGRSWAEATAGG